MRPTRITSASSTLFASTQISSAMQQILDRRKNDFASVRKNLARSRARAASVGCIGEDMNAGYYLL
jgi:hypothetical protein